MTNLSSLSKALGLQAGAAVVALVSCTALHGPAALAGGVLALAALGGAAYFILRTQHDIARAAEACHKLEKGLFDTRITNITNGGEVGALMWEINNMVDRMDAFVREAGAVLDYVSRNQYFRKIKPDGMLGILLNTSQTINTAVEQTAAKMNRAVSVADSVDSTLKNVVNEIGGSVGDLSSSSTTMKSTVQATRSNSDHAVEKSGMACASVQMISAAAEEMSASIQEISRQIVRTSDLSEKAVAQAGETRAIIDTLVETARQVGQIVALIDEVAGQTNLLALNATIESARAGDTGQAGQGRLAYHDRRSGGADIGRTPCRDELGAAPEAGVRD